MLVVLSFLAPIGKFLLSGWNWLLRQTVPAVAALLLALGLFGAWHGWEKAARARDKAEATINEMRAETKKAEAKNKATENQWRLDTQTIERTKDEALASAAADRDKLLSQLRDRPSRPAPSATSSPANGQAAPACTGAQLYRDDAQFLAREAAAADEVRLSLKACYSQYEIVREGLAK